ncbi:MAG: sugar phosphate isomerase/epimerase [Chloroflexota bacterium]|nr:sugar phosphate isomerase/epimerase [Chloroflexota bacterium]
MYLGFIVPRDLREVSYPELCAWAKEHGFAFVDTHKVLPDGGHVATAAGLYPGVPTVTAPTANEIFSPDRKIRDGAVRTLIEYFEQASRQGVTVCLGMLNTVDPTITLAQNFDRFVATWGPVVAAADRFGIRIALEPWFGWGRNLCYSPEMFRRVFATFDSPALGLCFDPSHFVWMGIDYMRVLREFAPRIYHVHAKDTEIIADGLYEYGVLGRIFTERRRSSGWWRYRLPGYGVVNWRQALAALCEYGYDGAISIEHEDPIYEGSEEKAQRGLILAQRYLEPFIA